MAPINLWNKCIDLRPFLKCKEGQFLRPLRSKTDQCWILRLRLQNFWKFGCQPRKSKAELCMKKRFQSSDLFDFDIFLFALLTRESLWGTIKKTNKLELWNPLSTESPPVANSLLLPNAQNIHCSVIVKVS